MGDSDKKLIEKFEADFQTLSSKNGWTPEDLEKMKNLQKLMYYLEVRCAMKEGNEYPGSEYMDQRMGYDNRSYASGNSGQNRSNQTGRYMSGRSNSYGMPTYGMSYTGGHRYYDGPHESAINDLRHMAMTEQDPEARAAMENALRYLEMR